VLHRLFMKQNWLMYVQFFWHCSFLGSNADKFELIVGLETKGVTFFAFIFTTCPTRTFQFSLIVCVMK
jgi:hypothetical protein